MADIAEAVPLPAEIDNGSPPLTPTTPSKTDALNYSPGTGGWMLPSPLQAPEPYAVASEDTNIILKSSDDVQFHVNALVLKLSSSVFRDMLAIPRPQDSTVTAENPVISLSERMDVLHVLLEIIYPGRGLSEEMDGPLKPALLPLLKSAALAANKYDMPSASRAIRAFLISNSSISKYNPVQLYGIAWDLGFIEEAKSLSTETLKCNLNTLEIQAYLENMGVTAVLKLQQLHRQRKVIMINELHQMTKGKAYYNDASKKYGVSTAGTYTPQSFDVPKQLKEKHLKTHGYKEENYVWSLLLLEVSRTMEERPDGSDFFNNESEFFFGERFAALSSVADLRMLSRQFRHILDSMPKTIATDKPEALVTVVWG